MTDIRTLLANALRQASSVWQLDFGGTQTYCDALAEALLALPGIAIVELPDPTYESDQKAWRFSDHGEHEYVMFPARFYPDDDIGISGIGGYSISEARALAVALLAAANAAEAPE